MMGNLFHAHRHLMLAHISTLLAPGPEFPGATLCHRPRTTPKGAVFQEKLLCSP